MKTIEKSRQAPEQRTTNPPIDVLENDQEFLLIADLPGVSQGKAEVTIEDGRLLLFAAGASRQYRRELLVPPSVDSEQVSAQMAAGVLTVHLPKRAPYRPRQIAVKSA